MYREIAWVRAENWCLDPPGIQHPESSPCRINLPCLCSEQRSLQGRGRVAESHLLRLGWALLPRDFQDNSVPARAGVPSMPVWISDFGACRVLRYYFGTQPLFEHMSAQLHCWNIARIKHTICFFQIISGAIHTFFSPLNSTLHTKLVLLLAILSLSPTLKICTELHSCWLHPYEQLPFRFPRWRRLVARFAALTGNEYELKGLYLRAVSFFCLRGVFFFYITKFPHKIDISGKGQRQTGDYRSNWISETFHCKGQPSAVGFQPAVPLLVSNTGEILHMPRYPLLFSLSLSLFFLN